MLTGWHKRESTMKYIALITALLLSASAQAKEPKPIETFGIVSVPEIQASKIGDCEYLGMVDEGGLPVAYGGESLAQKDFYEEAHKRGATHILVPSGGILGVEIGTYGSLVGRCSAQAFRCEDATDTDQKKPETPTYLNELKALATLRDDGIISEAEFQKQKAKILSEN